MTENVSPDAPSPLSRRESNDRVLATCTAVLWRGTNVVAAVCGGGDDYLIWLDYQREPCFRIPALQLEVREDFRAVVLPLIMEGRRFIAMSCPSVHVIEDAMALWGLDVLDRVAENPEIRSLQQLPLRPSLPRQHDEVAGWLEAMVAIALAGFVTRHYAK